MRRDLNACTDDAAAWSPISSDQWYAARDSTAHLRDALIAAGLADDFPFLRADLNAFGHGIVEVGRTTPEAGERIASLLQLGLSVGEVSGESTPTDND
ncbi:hypothetical protein BIV57_14310 [Mangrovactinospora gilvigrisea]|uniref:Uncharacterized protein n=1 Tax=Mangrovactinospora gilvigrisea TaxID=1428644 RepID=A0A1J7BTQ3_9ACTN|nr:hypothetical protein [Mangrovactinospora gilvigrisea]OIV36833.1 hypothetical protein BIV57_14310 [Mangrovactinospora gilvigrisea]